ncbi:MAG TPA: LamG domain-containing protein [Bacillota bacterium]|nr:LamG domain-containing protein [Bacillota bacterium]
MKKWLLTVVIALFASLALTFFNFVMAQSDPVLWYPFNETAGTTVMDSTGGGRNATLNGATWVAGKLNNAVNLSGTNQYVSLPGGVVSNLNDFTVAAWVKLDQVSTWSRIFDFGTGTTTNMFLTPTSGSAIRFAITTGGNGAEQQINGTAALPAGSWRHVAVTLSGNLGILYVDGVAVGRNANMTLKPSSLGNTSRNYLGRSQYSDPYLDGQLDDFRIYDRALSGTEIQALMGGSVPTPTGTTGLTPSPTSTPSTGKTFYTTSVNDGLDANDRVIFENRFKSLGYSFLGNNTNVSTLALNTLLGRSDITILYHTGHGYDSGIATAGGSLSVNAVSGINNGVAIFGTCLTLTSTAWKNKMKANCQNVFGYTNFSYDFADNDVANGFADQLKSGRSYIQAWYTANVAQSLLRDRWCGYVRESSGIVEYSARTGNTPKSISGSLTSMNSKGTLKVANSLLANQSTYNTAFSKICNSVIKVKGNRKQNTRFTQKGTEFLPKVSMSREKAVEIAKNWLSTDVPADAVQDSVTQIMTTDDSGTSKVVGQIVHYARYLDGLPIRSNGPEDHVALLVNSNAVAATSQIWPELEIKIKPAVIKTNQILSLSQAIRKASTRIANLIKVKQSVEIIDAQPCYGMTSKGMLVPAYEFTDSQGGHIIINAITADLVF